MQETTNDIVVFLIGASVLILSLIAFIVLILYLHKKKQIKYLERITEMACIHEKTLLNAQLEIQENTFQHISREIHDNISLSLTLAKLHLNTLNQENFRKIADQIHCVVNLISTSLTSLSNISKGLNGEIISSQGLIKAVEEEMGRIQKTGLFRIHVKVVGTPFYLEIQKELIIFRIIQEAFNNIIKHSRATAADLELTYVPGHLIISVSDNGVGFDHPENQKLECYGKAGLGNMKTRAKMIGGEMQIRSVIGKGSNIIVNIPAS